MPIERAGLDEPSAHRLIKGAGTDVATEHAKRKVTATFVLPPGSRLTQQRFTDALPVMRTPDIKRRDMTIHAVKQIFFRWSGMDKANSHLAFKSSERQMGPVSQCFAPCCCPLDNIRGVEDGLRHHVPVGFAPALDVKLGKDASFFQIHIPIENRHMVSSSSIMPEMIDKPFCQNAGSVASRPKGLSNSEWCFVPPAFSMAKYFSWKPTALS